MIGAEEIQTIKTLGGIGIGYLAIKESFAFVKWALKVKNGDNEESSKTQSRDRILTTQAAVLDIQERQKKMMPDVYQSIEKGKDIHEIVTRTNDSGDILIYNRGQDRLLEKMVENSEKQTKLLTKLLEKE